MDLGTLGGPQGYAWDINPAGDIVGYSLTTSSLSRATLWSGNLILDLGTLGGPDSIAYALNATGAVAGTADGPDGTQRAALWRDPQSTPLDLGSLSGGSWQTARDVNDDGSVILWGTPAGATHNHAAMWDGAESSPIIDLGTFGGQESWAYGINNSDQVVGWAELPEGNYHAFLWDRGEMLDLGTLGGLFSSAYAISDNGTIVGFAHDAQGQTHAVRWIPVPEPSGAFLPLLLLSFLALGRFRRRVPRRFAPTAPPLHGRRLPG